ncbi:MAG: hypothetical protein IIC79_06035 [Chloroflexi bacterium]|nr:hypothetical protein [Chloroflexota bacterium]
MKNVQETFFQVVPFSFRIGGDVMTPDMGEHRQPDQPPLQEEAVPLSRGCPGLTLPLQSSTAFKIFQPVSLAAYAILLAE